MPNVKPPRPNQAGPLTDCQGRISRYFAREYQQATITIHPSGYAATASDYAISTGMGHVDERNAQWLNNSPQEERIPIVTKDLRSRQPKRLVFSQKIGEARLKRLDNRTRSAHHIAQQPNSAMQLAQRHSGSSVELLEPSHRTR